MSRPPITTPLGAPAHFHDLLTVLRLEFFRREIDILGFRHDGSNWIIRFRAPPSISYIRVHAQGEGVGEGGSAYNPEEFVSSEEVDCRAGRVQSLSLANAHLWVWLVPVEKDALGTVILYDGEDGRPDAMSFLDLRT